MFCTKYLKIHYWPGITSAWFIFTFIITYLTSVLDGNVYPFFPYISDTGSVPPESCIFGQMLNVGVIFMAITVYLRYRQVNLAINSKQICLSKRWNILGLVIGFISCLGISIVGNFQETAVMPIHLLGAMMAFGIGTFYFYVQTRISFAFRKVKNKFSIHRIGKKTFYLRVFLAIFLFPLFVGHTVCVEESLKLFKGKSILYWTEVDGGFSLKLAASFMEWILVILVLIYLMTFTNEFKSLEYKGIYINIKSDDDHNSNSSPY